MYPQYIVILLKHTFFMCGKTQLKNDKTKWCIIYKIVQNFYSSKNLHFIVIKIGNKVNCFLSKHICIARSISFTKKEYILTKLDIKRDLDFTRDSIKREEEAIFLSVLIAYDSCFLYIKCLLESMYMTHDNDV